MSKSECWEDAGREISIKVKLGDSRYGMYAEKELVLDNLINFMGS